MITPDLLETFRAPAGSKEEKLSLAPQSGVPATVRSSKCAPLSRGGSWGRSPASIASG